MILFFFQELHLPEAVVNRLQTVGLRFCGAADQALPRLRGALPSGTFVIFYSQFFTRNEVSLMKKTSYILHKVQDGRNFNK